MIKADTPIIIEARELAQSDELASGELLLSLRPTLDDNQNTEETDRLVLGLDERYGNPNFDRTVTPYLANELLTEGSPRVRELFSQTVRDENRLAFMIPTVVRYHPTEWVEAKSALYDGGYASVVMFEQKAVATKLEYQAFINGMPVRMGTLRILASPAMIVCKDSWSLDAEDPEIEFRIVRESDQFVLQAKLARNSKLTLMVRRNNVAPPPERVAANLPPVWVTGSDLGLVSGPRTLVATDPEGYPVIYYSPNLPAGATLDMQTGELSVNATAAGNYTFFVDASDGAQNARREFTMRVNSRPVWQTPAGTLGTQLTGAPVSIQLVATDADNEPLTYSVVSGSLPSGISMNSTGLLSGTINGDGTFVVRVTDGTTPVDRQFILVSNAGPVWQTPAGSIGTFNTGSAVSFQFAATDPDGDPLVYSVVDALPAGYALSSAGRLTGTSGSEGSFTLRVTDPTGVAAERTFSISANSGPVWVTGANAVGPFAVGDNVSYQLVATDADNDPLTFSRISGATPRNTSVSTTALLSGGPIMPVTPEQLEFPISANTLVEVFINGVQTNNFTVNGQAYNPPVSTGTNWTFISPPPNNTLSPADSSYLVTYGTETYFKTKPLEAPFITDGSDFIPVPGQAYTVTYTVRKLTESTNGVQSCFRPAFDARMTDGTDLSASGAKYGYGYDPQLDFIFTDNWVIGQFYTINATWTAPAGSYQYARGRVRVNRTPTPGESWTSPPTFSNATYEIKSSEVSQGTQRPKSTVFVPAPTSDAIVRVTTRAISNPAAIVDDISINHYPVTSPTSTFTMRASDGTLTADRAFTVNTFKPDLPATEAYLVTSGADYAAATAPGNAPPSQQDIFNSWARFDGPTYYPTGTPPGGEATGWTYDNGTIKSTVNSGSLIGFVSPNDVSNYTHSVTMSSTNADDDSIAIVVAFALVNGVPNSLIAVRACGGNTPSWGLVHFAGTSQTILANGNAFADVAAGSPGWQGKGPSRVEVVRNGNEVSAVCSQMGSLVLDQATRLTYTIPADSPFAGAKPYGYAARSQADATFSDIAMTGGLDATVVYDGRSMPPKVMVYNFATQTWEQDLSRSVFRDFGYPRNITNPATGKTFRLNGPRPYSVTNLP